MAVNLINKVRHELTDDVIGRIASFAGETPANTESAIGYAVPATVGMMAQKAQSPQGAADLFELMHRGGYDGTSEGMDSLLRKGAITPDRIKTGTSMLSSLFGARQAGLTDLIAARTGIRPQSATSLLGLIAPFVMHMVAREATASGGFNASSIARLLGDQWGFIRSLAPAGLTSALGMSGDESAYEATRAEPARAYETTREPARAYTHVERTEPARAYDRGGGLGWLKWAIPLLLLGLLLWGITAFRHREPDHAVAARNGPAPVGTVGTRPLVTEHLRCGDDLQVAPDGVERKLIAFIDDNSRSADKETWFTFDRLEFETGSANLTPASQPQVRNIATIMRCYPAVHLKFGGYTDNTGDPAANQRLSQARAENARQAVISQGADPTRIEAEGYGQEHPVASNDTEDGRQRNRRIDARVTSK